MTQFRFTQEANFDGLIGPTHNYAGLSVGNIASENNTKRPSHPRAAFLQGLEKAKTLSELGLLQGVLPPVARPDIQTLKRLGFRGSSAEIINKVAKEEPILLASMYSASSMWTANAATISPSLDGIDNKVHITPANLVAKLHRSTEPVHTSRILKATFPSDHFIHHDPLPAHLDLGDEGAANHTRLSTTHEKSGHQLFVYGKNSFHRKSPAPKRYPARQTLAASQAIARLHQLRSSQVTFAQQNPEAIDAGVFHNDVISVGNEHLFFTHEQAFLHQEKVLDRLREKVDGLEIISISSQEVSLSDVVRSYLFNSQLVTLPTGKIVLIAPSECKEIPSVYKAIERLIHDKNSLHDVHYFDLQQSMRNGGGPACLRLRVVLTPEEIAATNTGSWLTNSKYEALRAWAIKHYRETLHPNDLADPKLLLEVRTALDQLTQLLELGSIYDFQYS